MIVSKYFHLINSVNFMSVVSVFFLPHQLKSHLDIEHYVDDEIKFSSSGAT